MNYSQCMNKATTVVFLLLFSLPLRAMELEASLTELENAWAHAYFQGAPAQQKQTYAVLLKRATDLAKRNPRSAEAKIWQATIMSASAEHQPALTALATLDAAKILLEQAIQENPKALNGAAYVTLGTLHYMLPGWPISFGDDQKAEYLLQTGLKINPDGIDANYFYGDFLLEQDRIDEAEKYLIKVVDAATQPGQSLSDIQLQNQARNTLANLAQYKNSGSKTKLQSLFASAEPRND
ncbi:MAG: hypothetical protein KGZ80_03745 [Methylomonas sp.]|nr:hypothetical protein [Methylomonas sp.]PPD22840.1 MAG: hypothetical protein CTY23_00500 [Methylomonas sp.]PPD24524.1 MAG: hypothetical protein CTY22_11060 [Methylomonas sp.]PPD33089.1 MAG: hypothetical protein CTY21_10985 [Methylomonas sp.]PPD41820.1 MAG: hypothetical protein CTY17_02775 [Methylomonas sp.]